jgi:DNA-binding CsgD family transcriptional regulator/PAS domain-containing protein
LPRLTEPPDKLLDLIYDAATDEALWTPALTRIAEMTSSVGGFLFGTRNGARLVTFTFNVGVSEESHRVYRERHFLNVWSAYMNQSPVGKLVRSDEIAPLTNLQRTAFFDEVLRHQGIGHSAMARLATSGDFQVGFNFCRGEGQGPFEADAMRLFSDLLPHLRRALLLGFRIDGYKALQDAAFSVLDRLSAGILILDRATRVVFANAAARDMTLKDGPLRLRNTGVTTTSIHHGQELEQLIRAALRGMPLATMSIPHAQDGRLFTVLVSSIRSRDLDRFTNHGVRDPAVLVVVTDPLRPLDTPPEWIMDAHGLTRAEANVALIAASGASIAEIAHKLGVSPNTVKTHLRRVFTKAGSRRQAELARLISSLAVVRANGNGASEPNET